MGKGQLGDREMLRVSIRNRHSVRRGNGGRREQKGPKNHFHSRMREKKIRSMLLNQENKKDSSIKGGIKRAAEGKDISGGPNPE